MVPNGDHTTNLIWFCFHATQCYLRNIEKSHLISLKFLAAQLNWTFSIIQWVFFPNWVTVTFPTMLNPSIFHYPISQDWNLFILWRLLCLILRRLHSFYISSTSVSLLYNNLSLNPSILFFFLFPFPISTPLIPSPSTSSETFSIDYLFSLRTTVSLKWKQSKSLTPLLSQISFMQNFWTCTSLLLDLIFNS